MALGLGFVCAIEDDAIRTLRSFMMREINTLRTEYGQTTIYPEIKYEIRGDTYEVIFEVDQRKCDLLLLLSAFLSVYQTEKAFRVTEMKAFSQSANGITTCYIDFEENDPKFRSNCAPIQHHRKADSLWQASWLMIDPTLDLSSTKMG